MITVKDYRKSYNGVPAVDGVSFTVQQGEIFGLLGPNGAGKTTILESLEGLRQPDSGSLSIAGIDPTRQPHLLRDLIGVQLQTSNLPETIQVAEAMKFFCAYHSVPLRPDLLDRMGLAKKTSAQYHELSTGLQRRLALALALAHNPKVLFLDEPTAGLDVPSRAELHSMIRELRDGGATILLATHDMAEAEALADRLAILLNGQIAAEGTPLEVTATGSGLTKISVYSQYESLSQNGVQLPAVHGQTAKDGYLIYFSTDIRSTLAVLIAHLERQHDPLIDLRVERPSLEDRFLEITLETVPVASI
jgi:ABC-2 type transport system ATP-binding protein